MRFFAIRCPSNDGEDSVTLVLDKNDLFRMDEDTIAGLVTGYDMIDATQELDWGTYLDILKTTAISIVVVEHYTFRYHGKWYSVPGDEIDAIIQQISGRVYRYGTFTLTERQLQHIIRILESLEFELVPATLDRCVDYFFKIPVGEYELYVFREGRSWAFLKDRNGHLHKVDDDWFRGVIYGDIDAEVNKHCECTS